MDTICLEDDKTDENNIIILQTDFKKLNLWHYE